jgi:hypothetical protein
MEVAIHMDWIYRDFIRVLDFSTSNHTDRFKAIVQLYIYSGALFEAWANRALRALLDSTVEEFGLRLFSLVERSPIEAKYEMLLERYNHPDPAGMIKIVRSITTDRNRLIHFKDKPDEVDDLDKFTIPIENGTFKIGDLIYGLRTHAPNPAIYNRLMSVDPVAIRNTVLETLEKLEATLKSTPKANKEA